MMTPKFFLPILIGCFAIMQAAYSQVSTKDSLIQVAKNSKESSVRVHALQSLINDFHLTETDIDLYNEIAINSDIENQVEQLELFHDIQFQYCYLGNEEKCLSSNRHLYELALKVNEENFICKSYLSLASYYFGIGEKENASEAMLKARQSYAKTESSTLKNLYYNELSRQKRVEGNLDSALYLVKISLENPDLENNASGLAISYNNMGRIYRQLGKMDSAEYNYLHALEISESKNLKNKLARLYNNLGNMNHIKGSYDEAIAYYVKSIEFKEKRGDTRGLTIGHHNIGAIKVDLHDYTGAIEEFKRSDELANKIDFKALQVHNANKIGESFYNLEEYNEANIYYERAMEISNAIGFKGGNTQAMIGSGLNLIKLGNMSLSISRLNEAYAQSQSSGNKSNECSSLIGIAEWYSNVENPDNEENYSFKNIENLLLRAKALSEELDYGEKRLLVYKGLDKLYKENESYKKHSEIMSEYIQYKDTLFSENRTKAIADWETKYSTAEKEKEIIQLQSANEISRLKTRSWQIALGIITFFLGLLGFVIYIYQKRKNEQKQMKEAEEFRSKISSDLHDDVGTILSSLAMQSEVMGLTAEKEQVSKFEKLSSMSREAMTRMRDTVWAIDARKDSMIDLLDRMKDYLYDLLEGHKMKASFNYDKINKEYKLRPDIRQNLYLIFKEAVLNASKYSNGDELNIILRQEKDDIYLEVRDNGIVDKSKIKTSGLGTSNMKMRAKRIGKELEISTENGFSVIVK